MVVREYGEFDAIQFFEFGMDRDVPFWAPSDWTKPVLHLGHGNKHIDGADELDWPEWDAEAICRGEHRLDYADSSVGGVVATHFLEHLSDPRPLIREVGRVLAPECPFNILVPNAGSSMWYHDLDHKSAFNLDTWKNLLHQPYYTKDRDGFTFDIGFNMVMFIKPGNEALVTQLIKRSL